MRFTIATAALVATASAGYVQYPAPVNSTSVAPTSSVPAYEEPVYVTKTVSEYETFCPGPTVITTNSKTYTVTEATTLTITDCPCTVTYPAEPTDYPVETPVVPSGGAPIPYPSKNGTAPVYPTGAPVPSKSAPGSPEFTGAAAQFGAAGLAVVGALAAFL